MNMLEPINIYDHYYRKTFHILPKDINIQKSIRETNKNLKRQIHDNSICRPYEIWLTGPAQRSNRYVKSVYLDYLEVSSKTYERVINLLVNNPGSI